MSIEGREPVKSHLQFDLTVNTEVAPSLLATACEAQARVWRRHFGTRQTTMRLLFTDSHRVPLRTDGPRNPGEVYYPGSDTTVLVMGRIMDPDEHVYLSPEQVMAIAASHGAMHKVQHHRGDHPRSSGEMTKEEYEADPHEREATRESYITFAEMYPKLAFLVRPLIQGEH